MNNVGYVRCLKCKEVIQGGKRFYVGMYLTKPVLTDFKCYYCGNYDKKRSQLEKLREKETEEIVRKMINYLQVKYFPNSPITVHFPERSLSANTCGWTPSYFPSDVYIPKQTLYLPHDQITDTSAHETAHILTWRDRHELEWENTYHEYRGELFQEYSWFVRKRNPNTKFDKGYNWASYQAEKTTYKSYWEAEYAINEEDLKVNKSDYTFNPCEDD